MGSGHEQAHARAGGQGGKKGHSLAGGMGGVLAVTTFVEETLGHERGAKLMGYDYCLVGRTSVSDYDRPPSSLSPCADLAAFDGSRFGPGAILANAKSCSETR